MKRSIVAVLGALLVLAACSSDSNTSTSSGAVTTTTTAATTASTSSSSPAAAGPTTSVGGLTSAQNATIGKKILVSDRTVTLYLFVPDGSNKTSQVPAGVKATWPAVIATDPAGLNVTGIDPSKVSVGDQPDGTKQLMYNGHLLYTYAGDTSPGQASGQGLGGNWFVLDESGNQIAA